MKIKGLGSAERSRGARQAPGAMADSPEDGGAKTTKKKISSGALEEARALIWAHRKRLAVGLALMDGLFAAGWDDVATALRVSFSPRRRSI